MCREQHKTLYVYCNSEHNALSPHAQLAYVKPVCFFFVVAQIDVVNVEFIMSVIYRDFSCTETFSPALIKC